MDVTPTLIQKKDNGKYLSIHFDDNSKFNILSELLRVESPSADVQGHGGPKIIVIKCINSIGVCFNVF